jgi:signal transduction histidine kinase
MASNSALSRHPAHPRVWRERTLDTGLALIVLAVTLGTLATPANTKYHSLDAVGVALAALASLPLIARRRAPLAVFVLTGAASVCLNALGYELSLGVGPTVMLYFLAVSPAGTSAARRLTAVAVISLFVAQVAADYLDGTRVPLPIPALVWAGVWIVGDRVRLRRERIAELEERALRAEREAERERRLAAAEERARIARDLHDSAGHAINVILVQAGAARLLSVKDPEKARAALATIEKIARETIEEIDQLVRVLREENVSEQSVEPSPGLAALDALVDRHRATGLDVTVHVRGERRRPAASVDQAAYRILREALTNAVRHGAGSAEVELAFGAPELALTVTNPTRPNWARARAGHGIVGMRERAVLLGGRLTAEGKDGSFRVTAALPYGAEQR